MTLTCSKDSSAAGFAFRKDAPSAAGWGSEGDVDPTTEFVLGACCESKDGPAVGLPVVVRLPRGESILTLSKTLTITSASRDSLATGEPLMLDIAKPIVSCSELEDEVGDGRGCEPMMDIELEREGFPLFDGAVAVKRGTELDLESSAA